MTDYYAFTERQSAMYAQMRAEEEPTDLVYESTPAQPRAWDAWIRGHIERELRNYDQIRTAEVVRDMGDLHDQIAELRDEVASLRADLTVATKIQSGEIKALRGRTDAA